MYPLYIHICTVHRLQNFFEDINDSCIYVDTYIHTYSLDKNCLLYVIHIMEANTYIYTRYHLPTYMYLFRPFTYIHTVHIVLGYNIQLLIACD